MKYLRAILSLCILLSLSSCRPTTDEPITKSGFYFDTVIQITVYDLRHASLIDSCFSYCEKFENLVSRTIADSDISRINQSAGNPVEVSDTTIDLLRAGIQYGDMTQGAFDITIAPLSMLWDFKNNSKIVPTDEQISEALSHVNYKNIVIEGNTVTLRDPKAAIDLGGIAKGYMADRLKEFLESKEVESALINLGGNVITIGEKPNGTPFTIGIQNPFDEPSAIITSVSAKDSSVVASGSYERYFEVGNKIYHHILNTQNGYPCENDLLSVTILSKHSIDGDALSTSCFALGLDKGVNFIQSLENLEAVFITTDYKIHDTRDLN